MKRLMLAAMLAGLAAPAFPCNLTAGPGAVVRLAEGKSGGAVSVTCIFGEKWELSAYWIGEQRIYDGLVTIEAFPAIGASRIWMFREGKRFRPFLSMGVMLKESQRCKFDGDIDCNRVLPLSFAFIPSAGFKLGDVWVRFIHGSNASLDYGPEKKNLGLDSVFAHVEIF